MFKKSKSWSLQAIIFLALIGMIMGIIYTYFFNTLFNVTKMLLLPTGYAPVMDTAFLGLWLMASPLAIYFVPKMGAGILGEVLSAIVEMAIGGQWGVLTVLEGFLQGASNEIGFWPRKKNYEKFSWSSVIIGAIFASQGAYWPQYFLYGWNHYSVNLQVLMFISAVISAIIFDGILVKLITKFFDKIFAQKKDQLLQLVLFSICYG